MGLVTRSRLQSIVLHASRKASLGRATGDEGLHGKPRLQPVTTTSSATAPANAPVTASAATPSENQRRGVGNVLTKKKDVAIWLSYEAALAALHPNRGQFSRVLKEARRNQRKYDDVMGSDAEWIRMLDTDDLRKRNIRRL